MASSYEAQIQALTREFMEELALLVRQQTLEVVLAQLEGRGPRAAARRGPRRSPKTVAQPQTDAPVEAPLATAKTDDEPAITASE